MTAGRSASTAPSTARAARWSDFRTPTFSAGNTLKFNTNFSRKDFSYGGNIVEYEIPNVLGHFYTADFSAGRDFYNSELNIGLRKEFIRPTDYEIGLTYSDIKSKRYMIDLDTRCS